MATALQFGAGNIGRGFMGQLLFEAGYRTVFVDADEVLVRLIDREGHYPLRLLDAASKREIDMDISNVSALATAGQGAVAEAFSEASVAGTAVGVANLAAIAPLIARGIQLRESQGGGPVDIYLCENSLDAFEVLREAVYGHLDEHRRRWAAEHVGFVGTVVARMVPAAGERFRAEGPLFVVADSYHRFPYDGRARRAPQPPIDGMLPVQDFRAEVERKLFTYNLVHAALAYLGYLKGYSYIHEPFDNEEVRSTVQGALEEVGRALARKFPLALSAAGQEEVQADINLRFSNAMIMDTVQRVGRDPIRKLGPEDRLIGAARMCLSQGIFPRNVARIAGAALCYDFPDDPAALRLHDMIERIGPEATLRQVSAVDAGSADQAGDLGRSIIEAYRDLRNPRG